jgi:hypothetical protein
VKTFFVSDTHGSQTWLRKLVNEIPGWIPAVLRIDRDGTAAGNYPEPGIP